VIVVRLRPLLLLLGACLAAAAGTHATAAESDRAEPVDRDPWVRFNRPVHAFNERVDDLVLEPAAVFYRRVAPDPVERAILNFFDNLAAPLSITGAALQADGDRTAVATSRFLVNSTIGVAGLLDPATPLGLPDVNEDIGQALEVWGLENSPYLVLPLVGPMTVVQIPDRVARGMLPQVMLGSYWHEGYRALDVVSYRAEVLAASTLLDSTAIDSYTFTREAFLQRRRYMRYNGELPDDQWDEFLDDF
jgi:phospholipid-binding lipoprotein MlaA